MNILAPLLIALPMLALTAWSGRILWMGLPKGEFVWMWAGSSTVNRSEEPFFYWFAFVCYVLQLVVFGFIGIGLLGLTVSNIVAASGLM